jgi:RHS repeat-associated protein
MRGTFDFTGQRQDATTGLDYYVIRYYDPLAAQFTSTDNILPGGGFNMWSLSRYAYVEGKPLIRTDPMGHFLPFDQIASAVSTVVQAVAPVAPVAPVVTAVVSTVATVADQANGISSIINDVQTIFSGNGPFFDKLKAGGDLLLNVAMDVTSVAGIGEGLKGAYLGAKAAAHAAEDGVHALEHAGRTAWAA